jgi:hypothetical protein
MKYVSVFSMDDGTVESLMGPFADDKEAMDWIDKDSLMKTMADSNLSRESSEEVVMVCDMEDDEPNGYMYQILEPSTPVEVVDVEETDT